VSEIRRIQHFPCIPFTERGAKSVVSIDLALPSAELLETLQQSRNSSVIRHVVGDICDQSAMAGHFKGATAVFHTAALVGPFHTTAEYDRVNHQGTRSVVDACRAAAVPVLVVTSSPSTKMDGSDIKHLHEKDLKVPAPGQELEEYARTKALGEAVALAAHSDKLRVCAVAPHQVYGTQDRLFLPSMLRAAASGRLRIFGAGDNLISCCHVDNAAHAHILAARQLAAGASGVGGEFFVIADGGAVYFWDAINQAVEACGLQSLHDKFHLSRGLLYPAAYLGQLISKFRSEPFRLTPFTVRMLTMHRYFAIDKAETALGYRALRSFAEAWPECIQAARTRLQAEGVLPAGGEEVEVAPTKATETKPIKTKRSTKAD
jgi:nucleoside-diphosphate-sugar epimerase